MSQGVIYRLIIFLTLFNLLIFNYSYGNICTEDMRSELSNKSSFHYIKMGCGLLAPTLGIGERYRQGNHGLDLSLNTQVMFAIVGVDASVTANARYLFYPYPNSTNAMYFGGGGGFGMSYCETAFNSMGIRGFSNVSQFPTIDGVVGWEFRRDKRIKSFIQIEVCHRVMIEDLRSWNPSSLIFSVGLGW